MKQTTFTSALLILLGNSNSGSSFITPDTGCKTIRRRISPSSATSLSGTIRFVGNASARLDTPSTITKSQDEEKSLSNFLTSSASDPVLLGSKKNAKGEGISQCRMIDDIEQSSEDAVLWECEQASVQWFGMELKPIFVHRIEKDPSLSNVVISIIDARTEVVQNGRLGKTLASAMKRSEFEGRNAVSWEIRNESAGKFEGSAQSYTLEGNLQLTLTINLPRLLPLPPGFNTIGSKIIERTCRVRLQQNLSDISDAYLLWATSDGDP